MARGMERNPGDYAQWTEEQLRDALLVILNTHYEGAATGETFNRAGKTDILVRVGDRSVFVGECKWWSGQQDFAGEGGADKSALDQLLSYATWRDSKLALAVFVNQQDIGAVITAAHGALEQHSSFIASNRPTMTLSSAHESSSAPRQEPRSRRGCRLHSPVRRARSHREPQKRRRCGRAGSGRR